MYVLLSFYNDRSIREFLRIIKNIQFIYQIIVIISRSCGNRVICIAVGSYMQGQQPDGNRRALNERCQPFPPVRGFGILSGVSRHKSYTVIVGGSMSSKAFHSMGFMKLYF